MVALNPAYFTKKEAPSIGGRVGDFYRSRAQNRVGDFFSETSNRVGSHEPVTLIVTIEITVYRYESASGLHIYLYANANPAMFIDPSGNITLTQLTVTAGVIGIVAGIAVPNIRGLEPEFDDATYGQRFGACIMQNGGGLALSVATFALAIDFGGAPLPKTPAELRGFGTGISDVTTRLSRFNSTFDKWLKNVRGKSGGPKFRGFRVAGRVLSAIRPVTNVVGAFAAGYAIGIVPGCAIVAGRN